MTISGWIGYTRGMYTLSPEAQKLDVLDPETLSEYAEDALHRPENFIGLDSDIYVTHTFMFSTPDWGMTNEYPVMEANFRAARDALTEAYPEDVMEANFGHWTYSRYSTLKVRVLDENGQPTAAFVDAVSIAHGLQHEYPILDHEVYSQILEEVWESTLKGALVDVDEDIREKVAEILTEQYYEGEIQEDYILKTTFEAAVAEARGSTVN